MNPAARQTLVDSYPHWYHAFDFGDGVHSKPNHPHPEIWAAISDFIAPVDFTNRSVLEIGCWDGYWSFQAERRGAIDVLATDAVDQRWGSARGLEIAHQLLSSKINYKGDQSIYDLPQLGRTFDIVICFGVHYHLTHLTFALTALRHVVAPGGTVLLEGCAIDDTERAFVEYLYGDGIEPERIDPSNWAIPSRKGFTDLLESNYFSVVREHYPFVGPRGRQLVEARAVERLDPHHPYPPPFGLARYDPRWRT